MSITENVSLVPRPSVEAEMYMYLHESGTTHLGHVQWFIAEVLHVGLVLHCTKSCKDYIGHTSKAVSGPVVNKERIESLPQVHTSGRSYTVCTACGHDTIGGTDARQQGHKLYNGARHIALAEKTWKNFYPNYPHIGRSIVTIMAEQNIKSILYGSSALLPASRAYTLNMLRSTLNKFPLDVDGFNHEMVCLSAANSLSGLTRKDSLVSKLCNVSDEETVHGLRIAWARGLNKSFYAWLDEVSSRGHTCPDSFEYVQSYSKEFLDDLGISKEIMLKAVSSWTQEYKRLRAMSDLEYVAVYGASQYHHATPQDQATIAAHRALIHSPVGSFAYGVMPKAVAMYLSESRVRNSKSPNILPLGIPYDPATVVDSGMLDTAMALFKSDNGIFYQNAEKSLQAAIRL